MFVNTEKELQCLTVNLLINNYCHNRLSGCRGSMLSKMKEIVDNYYSELKNRPSFTSSVA
jgi:hypothetical protein